MWWERDEEREEEEGIPLALIPFLFLFLQPDYDLRLKVENEKRRWEEKETLNGENELKASFFALSSQMKIDWVWAQIERGGMESRERALFTEGKGRSTG